MFTRNNDVVSKIEILATFNKQISQKLEQSTKKRINPANRESFILFILSFHKAKIYWASNSIPKRVKLKTKYWICSWKTW